MSVFFASAFLAPYNEPSLPLDSMRKVSLLLGAMGGALAGYLLSNEKLRGDLKKAKNPEVAAKLLGKHLQEDGSKIAKEVKEFVESDDVQKNLTKAKKFATAKFKEAKKSMDVLVKKGEKEAKVLMKKGQKAVKDAMSK
jgi:hypothetical protein